MGNNKFESKKNILERCVSDCEKAIIIHVLIRTGGDKEAAAELLGTTKRVMEYKIHKYGIECAEYKRKETR